MRNCILSIIFLVVIVSSCKNKKNIPDVTNIKLDLQVERFEQDFFNSDTNNLTKSFDTLNSKYKEFFTDYLFQILGLKPEPDSALAQAKLFLKDSVYNDVYKESQKLFTNINAEKEELVLGLKLIKHYFPNYNLPNKMITFVGPIDGYGCVITGNGDLAVGLQGFLGADYPAYQSGYIAQTYPSYKTRRFEKQYIPTNCITNILNTLFPEKTAAGKPLVERMVEKGKKMYVLDAILPNTADSIKIGYTNAQLNLCKKNEAFIWTFFVSNNLLFEKEIDKILPYVNDGPNTAEINSTAPGNIGLFVGWQIVKQYMKNHPKTTLLQLMQTEPSTIFKESNYAP